MQNKSKIGLFLPLRCLLFLAVFSLCSIATHRSLSEITHWWSVIASALNIVTILVLWRICKCRHITYRELIHYEKTKESVLKGILFIVIMLFISMAGMYLAGWLCYGEFPYLAPMMIAPIPPYLAIINVLILPITTTVAEDGLYLGYGVNGFQSKWTAVFIPAFFYALQHSFIPTMLDIRFITYRFLSFLPLTIWICYQYYGKRNPRYIMAGHWILNIATTVQIVMTSFMPEAYFKLIK